MKSRTILKYQYDEIGTFLCNTYVEKNHLLEKKAEAQKKIADLMTDNLPDIVKQAYKQYPDYFELKKRNIYDIARFIDANTSQYDPEQPGALGKIESKKKNYSPESIEFANYIYDSLDKLDLVKYSGSSYFGYNSTSKYDIINFDFIGLEISKGCDTSDSRYYNSRDNVHVIAKYALDHPEVKEIFLNYFIEVMKYLKFKRIFLVHSLLSLLLICLRMKFLKLMISSTRNGVRNMRSRIVMKRIVRRQRRKLSVIRLKVFVQLFHNII